MHVSIVLVVGVGFPDDSEVIFRGGIGTPEVPPKIAGDVPGILYALTLL